VLHLFAGEYRAAGEDLERAWQLAPGALLIREPLAYVYHLDGRDDAAREALVRELPPEFSGLEAATRRAFEEGGYVGGVRAHHAWLVAGRSDRCSNEVRLVADPLAILGEADTMFECLQRAIDRKDMVFLKSNPTYDPYRADPRYAALLRRMNLAE
jgi:hypothetical protein